MLDKKSTLLGMPIGTAANRLRKSIMFSLVCEAKLNTCHRCGNPIESVDMFSIDHKESWENHNDPVGAFFDINNIAFAHPSCNYGAARRPNKRFSSDAERYKFHDKRKDRWGGERRKLWRQKRRKAGLPYT